MTVKRLGAAAIRRGLRRYARAAPKTRRRDVTILLMSAWGMGGTIRAAHNLAGHLAEVGHRVELLSVFRTRDEPFFGAFPEGVTATALDDRRENPFAARLLRRLPSVLIHPTENSRHWNLWRGRQVARLMKDDGYAELARTSFRVR